MLIRGSGDKARGHTRVHVEDGSRHEGGTGKLRKAAFDNHFTRRSKE